MKKYNVGFVGAGLQAARRIPVVLNHELTQMAGIASKSDEKLQSLAQKYSLKIYKNWQELVKDPQVDLVVVCTYPDSHAEIAIEAVKNGKHVLCEKPLSKTIEEGKLMVKAAQNYHRVLKCGFNHRFHPAIWEAKNIVEKGQIGGLLFGRGIYGYCGRPGFEKEWRSSKKYAAGGILMEQGIHLIDLCLWFFGDIVSVGGMIETNYWPIPFEDNAMVLLKTKKCQTIMLQATNLQWKNKFSLEIFGTSGYLAVDGLGQSYGVEKLTVAKKDYQGPFKETVTEYRGNDISWEREWDDFISAVRLRKKPLGDGTDGVKAMQIVEAVYSAGKMKKIINL